MTSSPRAKLLSLLRPKRSRRPRQRRLLLAPWQASPEKLLAKLKALCGSIQCLQTQAAEEMLVVERGLTARLREEVDMAQARWLTTPVGTLGRLWHGLGCISRGLYETQLH